MRARGRYLVALAFTASLVAGCSADEPDDATDASAENSRSSRTSDTTTSPDTDIPNESRVRPVSVPGLAEQRHTGDRLRLEAVRERTSEYTSYDVTYRSRSTTPRGGEAYTISGVINIPHGRGPFPAVVLAHG